MNKIKSPMNYIGNKYRILDQIKVYFPDNIKNILKCLKEIGYDLQ